MFSTLLGIHTTWAEADNEMKAQKNHAASSSREYEVEYNIINMYCTYSLTSSFFSNLQQNRSHAFIIRRRCARNAMDRPRRHCRTIHGTGQCPHATSRKGRFDLQGRNRHHLHLEEWSPRRVLDSEKEARARDEALERNNDKRQVWYLSSSPASWRCCRSYRHAASFRPWSSFLFAKPRLRVHIKIWQAMGVCHRRRSKRLSNHICHWYRREYEGYIQKPLARLHKTSQLWRKRYTSDSTSSKASVPSEWWNLGSYYWLYATSSIRIAARRLWQWF